MYWFFWYFVLFFDFFKWENPRQVEKTFIFSYSKYIILQWLIIGQRE